MAAKVIGQSTNEQISALVPMLAGKLPDDYELLVWSEGFYVQKDADATVVHTIGDKEFRRIANFAMNHALVASVGIVGGVPSINLRIK